MRFALFALMLSVAMYGQQTSANLTGSVSDATSAVIPDVLVRATNKATNVSREARSAGDGSYTIPLLPAGDYAVTATKPGFRSYRLESMPLQVGQVARLDLQLQIGEVTESVNVEASGAILQTENSPSARSLTHRRSWTFR